VLTHYHGSHNLGNVKTTKQPNEDAKMSHLSKVKKAVPQAPVITIVGFPGVGKSTLAAMFPNPIFVQAENASTVFETWSDDKQPAFFPELPAPKNTTERQIKTSEFILDQLRELITEQHDFKTVIVDTVTSLNTLFENEVVEFDANPEVQDIGNAAGGFHKGFLVVAGIHTKIRNACEHLRRKGIAVVFLAHTGVVKMKNRPDAGAEYTAYSIDMAEKSRHIYVSSSDAVLYLKSRDFVMGHESNKKGQTTKFGRVSNTGERVLITSSDGTIGYVDAKNRYAMPEEIEVPHGTNPLLEYIPFFNPAADTSKPAAPVETAEEA
jgi:hypothetical protein